MELLRRRINSLIDWLVKRFWPSEMAVMMPSALTDKAQREEA